MSKLKIGKIDGEAFVIGAVAVLAISAILVPITCSVIRTNLEKPKYHLVCTKGDVLIIDEPNAIELPSLNERKVLNLGAMRTTYRVAGSGEFTTVQGLCTVTSK